MTSERWEKMWSVFHEARALPDNQQAEFVRTQCVDDHQLEAEVLKLLSQPPPDDFLSDEPLVDEREADQLLGTTIGHYHIESVLGEGGMGKVYLARECGTLDRQVAIKVVRRGMDSESIVKRFLDEQDTLARLQHANIAAVFHAGIALDGRPYFAMEYVTGVPITAYCRNEGLSLGVRLEILAQVCDVVHFLHQKGVLHRDLKPSNILVETETRQVKLIDFGIARAVDSPGRRHTRAGEQVGTPDYMSPEQAGKEEDVDTRSDVYALGVLAFELLTGELPARDSARSHADTPSARIRSRSAKPTEGERRPPNIPEHLVGRDLDWIVMKALAEDREERYGSAAAMAQDLRLYLDNQPVSAAPPSKLYRARKFFQRHPLSTASATIAMVLLLGLVAMLSGRTRALNLALLEAERNQKQAQQIADFMVETFTAADPFEAQGEQTTAADLLNSGVDRIDDLDAEASIKSELLRTISNTYRRLGDFDRADSAVAAALDQVDSDGSTAERKAHARALASLSTLRNEQGRYAEVEALTGRALAMETVLYGPADARLAEHYVKQAVAYRALGKLDEAEAVVKQALAQLTFAAESQAARHRLLTQLAGVYLERGQVDRAEASYVDSLEYARSNLPAGHPEVGTAHNNLAVFYYRTGKFEQAGHHYDRALAIHQANLGEDHPLVGTMHNNLGALRTRQDRLTEARTHLEAALRIRTAALGPAHLEVGVTNVNLGGVYKRLGLVAEAAETYDQALTVFRAAAGPDDRRIGVVLNRKAALSLAERRLGAAKQEIEEALRVNLNGWPTGHRVTADSHRIAGEIALSQGDLERAVAQARQAWVEFSVIEATALQAAQSRGLLGRALVAIGDPEQALEHLRHSQGELLKLKGPEFEDTQMVSDALDAISGQ